MLIGMMIDSNTGGNKMEFTFCTPSKLKTTNIPYCTCGSYLHDGGWINNRIPVWRCRNCLETHRRSHVLGKREYAYLQDIKKHCSLIWEKLPDQEKHFYPLGGVE